MTGPLVWRGAAVIRPGRRVIDIQAGEFTLAASRGISSVAPLLQGLHRPTDDGLRPALKVESRPCRLRALLKRGLADELPPVLRTG
jgi:hypothetical protein